MTTIAPCAFGQLKTYDTGKRAQMRLGYSKRLDVMFLPGVFHKQLTSFKEKGIFLGEATLPFSFFSLFLKGFKS